MYPMRDLPVIARFLINIVLYVVYVVLFSIVFSILFPIILQVMGKNVLNPADPVFVKIQIFIAILVLLISLIFRKFFYLCGNDGERVVVVEETVSTSKTKTYDSDDEDIKIYVEKEIK